MTTRDGEFPPRASPVQGGRARAFAPSVRSESAGRAVRPPEGDPSRRSSRTWEHGDVSGADTIVRRPTADIAVSVAPIACPDKGANFTIALEHRIQNRFITTRPDRTHA